MEVIPPPKVARMLGGDNQNRVPDIEIHVQNWAELRRSFRPTRTLKIRWHQASAGTHHSGSNKCLNPKPVDHPRRIFRKWLLSKPEISRNCIYNTTVSIQQKKSRSQSLHAR